ncbi:MAG: FecR domain-containing protein, partial [Pseudomonadales bacterium]
EEQEVARLLALAGPRTSPPADVEARVRAATLAAFDALPDPEVRPSQSPARTFPQTLGWALAASLLLSIALGWLLLRDDALPRAGEIRFATGGYTVRGSGDGSTDLLPGSIVRTSSEGRLLVDLGGRRDLRVDQGTSLTLHSDSEVWLHGGRIYVDAAGRKGLVVVTPNASITDLGTQFEVVVSGERLDVTTREGAVEVAVGGRRIQSRASPGKGEALMIDGVALRETGSVPTTGERWAWTQASRPEFSVGGRSVREYLDWAAREGGRVLVFTSPLSEQQADLRRLGGSGLVDADPASVARVLAATSFELQPGSEHELVVGLIAGEP